MEEEQIFINFNWNARTGNFDILDSPLWMSY